VDFITRQEFNVRPANLQRVTLRSSNRDINDLNPTTQSNGSTNAYEYDGNANDKHEHAYWRHGKYADGRYDDDANWRNGHAACALRGASNDPTAADNNCDKEKVKLQRKLL
jgi:hypothetical protein